MTSERVRVAAADELESGEVARVTVGDAKVVLVRVGDEYYALSDRCSHANYSLSEGEVDCDEKTLTCWKHGAEFSLLDGEPQTLPATQPVPVYPVEVADGEVYVTLPGRTRTERHR